MWRQAGGDWDLHPVGKPGSTWHADAPIASPVYSERIRLEDRKRFGCSLFLIRGLQSFSLAWFRGFLLESLSFLVAWTSGRQPTRFTREQRKFASRCAARLISCPPSRRLSISVLGKEVTQGITKASSVHCAHGPRSAPRMSAASHRPPTTSFDPATVGPNDASIMISRAAASLTNAGAPFLTETPMRGIRLSPGKLT